MKWLLLIAITGGGALLFLLATASANTALFARHYPWLLALNVGVALSLLVLLAWQISQLWRDYRAKVFGSRLKLRLMLMFGLMAILPGTLIYGVSAQFLTNSIESWFDVRIEKALESGLALGRSSLDTQLAGFMENAQKAAQDLAAETYPQPLEKLESLRDQASADTAALFSLSGQLLGSAASGLKSVMPNLPSSQQLHQARIGRGTGLIEGEGKALFLRAIVPVIPNGLGTETRLLQLTQTIPASIAQNAEAVQDVYRDYQEIALGRQGLTRIFSMTLTLTVLLSLFAAFVLAFVMARRLSAPLSILAEGTKAVAAGDFTPRQAINGDDELGVLTRSFNQMTRQLDDARHDAERHQAYLESILANLSTGVLVFDRHLFLRKANDGATHILNDSLSALIGEPPEAWPNQQPLGQAIRSGFARHTEGEWQEQIELLLDNALPQVLLLRGSRLPAASEGGYLVVFDDITRLVAAQRSAAWGEVARRLAHEIKNPLTPIQLSAERLQMKLQGHLSGNDADMLQRSTQTIINQVQAMKHMVDEFRDYARMPAPEMSPLDLNALVGEVLGLYETSPAHIITTLDTELPPVLGDPTQLRQIIHNLLRNAEDAQESLPNAQISIKTQRQDNRIALIVSDNGPGFPADIMARVFEPYVTTKPRGTGLGLAIVKKIIDEHSGSINITNRETGGAQITLCLPLAPAEKANHGTNTRC